eukprot:TRINITY_DN95931_c0_g1_i1.p1 TRINITY_DN95931_c0_g1~~TRINITY_DN95931_c0_g1_i1.p1  ORF type:complete len:358 (+),score=65.90 TRINITY_DN95931_c0_g1_i1:79-1152(+)
MSTAIVIQSSPPATHRQICVPVAVICKPTATSPIAGVQKRIPTKGARPPAVQGRPPATPHARQTLRSTASRPFSRQEMSMMPITLAGQTASPKTQQVKRILCYGDSLTAGFFAQGFQFEPYGRTMSETLSAAGIPCEVSICGHSGKTTKEMVAGSRTHVIDVCGGKGKGLARILEESNFDLVMIMSGTNDMGQGLSHSSILQDLQTLHETCHARGVPTVALIPPPAPGQGQQREMQRLQLADRIVRLASSYTSQVLACVDPGQLVPGSAPQFWESDGLHFSACGSKMLGKLLAGVVSEKLSSVAQVPKQLAPPPLTHSVAVEVPITAARKRAASKCASELKQVMLEAPRLHFVTVSA